MSNKKPSRRTRKQAAKQNEKRSTPEVTTSQAHQELQTSTSNSSLINESQSPTKAEPTPVAEGDNGRNDVPHIEEAKPLPLAPKACNKPSHFPITITAYLLGLLLLLTGTAILLWDPPLLTKHTLPLSPPAVTGTKASPSALRLNTLILGKSCIASGLTMLTFVYTKQLRALGLLLLCEYVAESVATCASLYAGVESHAAVRLAVSAVKGVLGVWMICSG